MKVSITLPTGVRVSITTDSATEVGAVLRELGVPGEPTAAADYDRERTGGPSYHEPTEPAYPERGGDDEPSPEEIRQASRESAQEAKGDVDLRALAYLQRAGRRKGHRFTSEQQAGIDTLERFVERHEAQEANERVRYPGDPGYFDPAADDVYVPAADRNGNPRWWYTAETEPPDASAGKRFDTSHPTGPGIDGEPPDTCTAEDCPICRETDRVALAVHQPFEPAEVVLPSGRVWPVGTDAWSWDRVQADGTLAYGACTERESAYAAAGLPLPVPEPLPRSVWFDPGSMVNLNAWEVTGAGGHPAADAANAWEVFADGTYPAADAAKAAASVSQHAGTPDEVTIQPEQLATLTDQGRQDVTEGAALAQGEEITESRLSPPCQDDDALLSAANAVAASDAATSATHEPTEPVRERTTGKSVVGAPGGCVLLYRGSGWSWRCTVPGWQHSKGGYDTRADALAGVEAWLASAPGENDGGTLDLVDREHARSRIPPGGRLWYQRLDEAYGSRSGWCWELPQAPDGQGVIGVTDGGPHFYYRDALHALRCAADKLGLPAEAGRAPRPTADLPPNKPPGGRRKDGQPHKRRKVNVPGDGGTSDETAKQDAAPVPPAPAPPDDDATRRSRTPEYRAARNEGLRKVRETDPLPEVDLASRLPHRPSDPKLYVHPGAGWGPMEDGGIVKHLVCKGKGCDACNHQGCRRCIEKPPRKWKSFGAI